MGFYELLEGMAQICERECSLLPANVSPDCAIQLTHVSHVLRSQEQSCNEDSSKIFGMAL